MAMVIDGYCGSNRASSYHAETKTIFRSAAAILLTLSLAYSAGVHTATEIVKALASYAAGTAEWRATMERTKLEL